MGCYNIILSARFKFITVIYNCISRGTLIAKYQRQSSRNTVVENEICHPNTDNSLVHIHITNCLSILRIPKYISLLLLLFLVNLLDRSPVFKINTARSMV